MMRADMRRELYKLREIVHFMFAGAGATPRGPYQSLLCFFCKKSFVRIDDLVQHGNSVGPKFEGGVTIHHVDGNHENKDLMNEALCHTSCHKSYHRKLENMRRAAARSSK